MSNDAIRDRITKFTVELEALVRAAAIDAVKAALGGSASGSPSVTRSAQAHRPTQSKPTPSATPIGTAKLAFKRRKGSKRTPEQLAQIDGAIVSFVKANPGKGVEHMGKALNVPTSDLKLRVLGLFEQKKIKKTGVKRATKYFPV